MAGGLQLELVGIELHVLHLRLGDEVDESVSSELEERLTEMMTTRIELDLSELTFIDSAGIQVLENVDARLRGQGGFLTLVGVRDHIRRVLEILDKESWMAPSVIPEDHRLGPTDSSQTSLEVSDQPVGLGKRDCVKTGATKVGAGRSRLSVGWLQGRQVG